MGIKGNGRGGSGISVGSGGKINGVVWGGFIVKSDESVGSVVCVIIINISAFVF